MDNYEKLIDQIEDGLAVLQDGVIKVANSALIKMSGYSREELIGMTISRLLTPKSQEVALPRYLARMTGEDVPAIYETQAIRGDGEIRNIRINATRIVYQGRPADQILIRNLTEVRELEKARRESEDKYQLLVTSVNDVLFELNQGGNFTFISPNIEKITAFKANDILGRHFSTFIHPDDLNGIQLGFEYTPGGQIESRAYRIKNKDGSDLYLRATVHIKMQDNHPAGVIGILTDVTLRQQAEEALRNREEYFRELTENASDVILTLKSDGQVKYATPSIKNIIGYRVHEITGTNILDYVFPGDSLAAARLFVYSSSNPGYTGKMELRLNHKDGSLRYVEIIGKNALENSAIRGLILNVHDITDRKKSEERQKTLEQDLHLSSRLASIGQLAAGLAHEINNPLTSIIGFSQLLIRRDLPPDVMDKIKIINSEAQRVARIVQGLLTFARQDELQRGWVDINDTLSQILKLRSYSMNTHNIEVIREFDPNLPRIIGDAAQIQQVFLNIVLNAEKEMIAAHGRGRLTLKTEKIASGIRISVADDGPGVSPENMRKLFTPFFTTRKVGEGTGLGLSICHGIVTRHKGRIYAQSQPGEGATFYVELPVSSEKPASVDKNTAAGENKTKQDAEPIKTE